MNMVPRSVMISIGLIIMGSCGGQRQVTDIFATRALANMQNTADRLGDVSNGKDRWEVAICRIPLGVSDPRFEPIPDRLQASSADIVAQLEPVQQYFWRWSQQRYEPIFIAAADVAITAVQDADSCVEQALDRSDPATNGVLIIADARHSAVAVGGWGRPGNNCVSKCSARETRRAVYVGAADFMAQWNNDPPLDLIEHEIGHALDWPHSSTSANNFGNGVYDSAVDLMSDSAAPRRIEASVRHAPGVLAINLLMAGWIDDSSVVVLDRESPISLKTELVATHTLASIEGRRLAIIEQDDQHFYTVELIAATGDNAHLSYDRVVIHAIEVTGEAGFERQQTVVTSDMRVGARWSSDDVTVSIESISTRNGVHVALIEITREG